MNINLAFQLIQNMGLRYTSYRIIHELEKRLGILKRNHPILPKEKRYISLTDWKKMSKFFVIEPKESIVFSRNQEQTLQDNAHKILRGEICFFSSDWKNLGLNYDWITNPETNFKYDVSKHWSEINDFNPKNGDIKYVWEKSRFTFLLTIIRYDYHFNEDNASFVFSEIESWIDANPINQGPNWKCSQEISLRLFNWMYALEFYKNSGNDKIENGKKEISNRLIEVKTLKERDDVLIQVINLGYFKQMDKNDKFFKDTKQYLSDKQTEKTKLPANDNSLAGRLICYPPDYPDANLAGRTIAYAPR